MICDDAIMACQGKLKTTAQRKAVERASDRLCRNLTRTKVLGRLTARFHFAQQCVQGKSLIKGFFRAAGFSTA